MDSQANFFLLEGLNAVYLIALLLVFVLFTLMGVFSFRGIWRHQKKKHIGEFSRIRSSSLAPDITIIAPAFNESLTIVENVRSLLYLRYDNYDIMVVNDGSEDDTLEKLIRAYDLEKAGSSADPKWDRPDIRGVYRSKNPDYQHLTVVDKVKGGKSKALNTGLQLSASKYVGCIDVDCLLHPDALLHVVRAFTQKSRKRVVAVGGVIRIANSCKVNKGILEEIRLPENWLARFQLLEYTRSFLMARMAWKAVDSLMIISGAFGFFDREIALEVGGYDPENVGEDLEIVFRMRRHMHERGIPYTMEYLPDPLCWTEVPEDLSTLVNQRDRWSRGNIETLHQHRKMAFNGRYGRLGMLGYPYWLFYEGLSPLLEFAGFLIVLFCGVTGVINSDYFIAVTLALYSFSVLFSFLAILWEVMVYNQYTRIRDLLRLMVCALLEPVVFHPIVVWSSVRGILKKALGVRSGWGRKVRKGFAHA